MENTQQASLPSDFLERLQQQYGSEVTEQITEVLQHGRPTTFRPNILKTDFQTVAQELESAGFELEKVEWLSAFILKNRSLRELEEHPLYLSGSIYVQGLSSMIPPLVLEPKPGDAVLD